MASVIRRLQAFQEPILVFVYPQEMLLAVSDLLDQPHLAQYKNGEPTEKNVLEKMVTPDLCLEQVVSGKGVDFSTHPCLIQVI